ncbi:MAG: tryptophan--tRNA ligase [Candidatus Margulisbacteria bacterium]|nr:tryptophan--tRNA ligase [Candidatus Margulisiibacteriota bacterium]
MKKRVLSGIQPTGKLHLGNLIGAIENWVKLQDEFDCYFFIADLHALTTAFDDKDHLKEYINDVAIDLLAAGLDPKKCVVFKQSDLPEHSELHLMLSMVTPVTWLERVPTYKSKIEEMEGKDLGNYGFLGYPVLQAADILMYKADFVPVGQDQLPHIELTREIARRFNNFFGNTFAEPKHLLTKFPTLPGIDGRKMSKSYNNTIAISDPPEVIAKKVSTMVTDPARVKKDDPGHPEVCSAHYFYKIFGQDKAAKVAGECQAGSRGCVACKKELAEVLEAYLAQIHEKRKALVKDQKKLDKVLFDGAAQAKKIATKTLSEAKQAMGLI